MTDEISSHRLLVRVLPSEEEIPVKASQDLVRTKRAARRALSVVSTTPKEGIGMGRKTEQNNDEGGDRDRER